MNVKQLDNWLEKFGRGWERQDPEAVMGLFDKKRIEYFESALKAPCRSRAQVKKLWQVVPKNQKNVKFSHEILACTKTDGIVRWKVSRIFLPAGECQKIDGIFHIRLNSKNLCTYFNQWRTVEEE